VSEAGADARIRTYKIVRRRVVVRRDQSHEQLKYVGEAMVVDSRGVHVRILWLSLLWMVVPGDQG